MNQTVTTELIIDSRGAEAGSAAYVRATQVAQAAYDRFIDRQNAAGAASAANEAKMLTASTSTQRLASAYDRLKASIDPVFAASKGLERDLVTLDRAVTRLGVSEAEAARMMDLIRQRHDAGAAAARRNADATDHLVQAQNRMGAAGNDNSAFRRQNLGYQAFDIGQGLALGMNPAMILAQQGPQIAQIYAAQGGLNALWKDSIGLLGGVARAAGPWIAAAGALYAAYKMIGSYSAEAALKIDSTTAALAAQAAPIGSVASSVNELASLQKTYAEAIDTTWRTQDAATDRIVAATEREFNAKKSLLELELKRQEASIKAQQAEMAVAGLGLRKAVGGSVFPLDDGEARGFSDPRIGPFVRNPAQDTLLDRTRDVLENNPLSDRITELRANLELTELGAEKLREALKATFNDGSLLPGGSRGGPASNGKIPVPTFRGVDDVPASVEFMDSLSRSTANRVAQLKAEAGALDLAGEAATSYRFVQEAINDATAKGIELSPAQIGAIKRQADELARLADATAKATLGRDLRFERDQLLRSPDEQTIASRLRSAGRPVDLKGEEAGLIRVNLQLEKQRDLWEDIRATGMSAIDKLVDSAANGFTDIADTFEGIAKDITKQMLELGLANPMKNAVYGAGLPTLETAGSTAGELFTLNLTRSADT